PIFGVEAARRFIAEAWSLVGSDVARPRAALVGVVLLAMAGVALAAVLRPLPPRARLALGGSWVLVTAAALLGGIGARLMSLTTGRCPCGRWRAHAHATSGRAVTIHAAEAASTPAGVASGASASRTAAVTRARTAGSTSRSATLVGPTPSRRKRTASSSVPE